MKTRQVLIFFLTCVVTRAETHLFNTVSGWQIKADFIGNDTSGGSVRLQPWSGAGAPPAFSWQFNGGSPQAGTWNAGEVGAVTVCNLPASAFYSSGSVKDLTATVGGDTYSWGNGSSATGTVTMTVVMTLKNNVNRIQTMTVGAGGGTQSLGALQTATKTFTVMGQVGDVVTVAGGPDAVIWDTGEFPLVISRATPTVSVSGHFGAAQVTQHIHCVVTNFATTPLQMGGMLDGSSVGSFSVPASSDGVMPSVTSYDWNVSFSPDSVFSLSPPTGHSVHISQSVVGNLTTLLVTLDEGATPGQATTSTTQPDSQGNTTTIATNPVTGTTQITHTTPQTPTNASTDPTAVFGSSPAGTTVGGSTFNNTTPQAGSAASQDASASLATIANNTKQTADNTSGLLKVLTPPSNYSAATDLATAQTKAASATQYTGPQPSGSASVTMPSASSNGTLATWNIGNNTVTVSMLPTAQWSGADGLLRACRSILIFAALVAFAWSCSRVINQYVSALPQVGQAESNVGIENLIPGVTQGKTWGSAALLVGAMVVACGAIVVILNTWMSNAGYGIATLFSGQNLGPVGKGLSYIDSYIPVAIIFQLGVLRAGFSFLVAPIYLGTASVMKFLKA